MNANDEDSLERRVRRLEDERAVYRVLARYGEGLDYGLVDQVLNLFTENGSWILQRGGRRVLTFTGRDQIRVFAQNHPHAPEHVMKHVFVDPQIAVGGDRAEVTSYFMRLDAREDKRATFIFEMGRYFDILVRCPDGNWRFEERIVDGEDDRENRVGP